jgi:phosphatidylcholine synthase
LFVIDAGELAASIVVAVSVILTFMPISFLHPVASSACGRSIWPSSLSGRCSAAMRLLLHFDTPAWVVAGVVGTGIYLYVIGFVLQIFPRLGRG